MEPRDESISARSQHVRQRLQEAVNKKSLLANAASWTKSLAAIDVSDALERFTLWAGNLGAILPQTSRLSLDRRLADAPETSERICEVLDDLAEAITDLLDLLQEAAYDVKLDRDGAPGASTLSCEDSSPTSDDRSLDEAQPLLDIISEYLRSLFRIASLVRNSGPRDRFTHAIRSSNTVFTNTLDISHLREKHPKLPANIRQSLGDANAKRRQFIKYCHDHRTRLETERREETVAQVTESQPARTELLSSKATTFAPIPVQLLKPAPALGPENDEIVDDCVSMASMSTFSGANMTLRLPQLSVLAPDRETFECPICCTFQCFSLEQEWRAHAFRDLKAYTCTFGCPDMYGDKRAWFDHELRAHRRRFACQLCPNTDNLSESEFRQHLGAAHGDISEKQHDKFLDSGWEAMSTLPASDCPFCDDWTASLRRKRDARGKRPEGQQGSHEITVSVYQFMRHVGAHQEQLAIFAVPRKADDDSDAGTPDSGTFGYASVDLSLDSDDGGDLAQASDPPTQGPVREAGENTEPDIDAGAELDVGSHYLYDTQTPVFVKFHSPGAQQSSSSSTSSEAAPSSSSRAGASPPPLMPSSSPSPSARGRQPPLPLPQPTEKATAGPLAGAHDRLPALIRAIPNVQESLITACTRQAKTEPAPVIHELVDILDMGLADSMCVNLANYMAPQQLNKGEASAPLQHECWRDLLLHVMQQLPAGLLERNYTRLRFYTWNRWLTALPRLLGDRYLDDGGGGVAGFTREEIERLSAKKTALHRSGIIDALGRENR